MRSIVPLFILKQARAGNFSGRLQAIVLNIDLIGFTALTQSIMKNSHTGVEALTDTINATFTPAIAAIESRGGFIAGFAGDAFTAVFEDSCWAEALAAAMEVRDYSMSQGMQKTEFGEFELAVRIGIGRGEIAWEINPHSVQSVHWFSGSGIMKAVEAQTLAKPNEVIASYEQDLIDYSNQYAYERVGDSFCKIINLLQPVPPWIMKQEQFPQNTFVPESLAQLQVEGEFRDVLSCFVNLHENGLELRRGLIDSAIAHGGYISHIDCTDKGWVMFVMFGAPKSYDQNQLRAMSFVLEQQARCGRNLRIGLSEGRAYAGFIGSASRGEYTGMGKAVNLAARFMMKAKWGEIWLDQALQKAVGNAFICKSMGALTFKGYPQLIEAYRLIAKRRGTEYRSFNNKLRGRDCELEQLSSSCKDVFAGRFAGITYIYGAAGQGKSRLLFELKQKMGNAVHYINLQSDSIHKIALSPFSAWIRNDFNKGVTGAQSERIAEFRKNWAELSASFAQRPDPEKVREELNRIESLIAGLIGLEWEGSIYSLLEPKNKPAVTEFAIKSLIEILCLRKPVILVVEDLHWLDKESENILTLLSRKASATPLKIIITSRLRDDGSKPEINLDGDVNVDSLELDGLNTASVRALMQDQLSQPVSDEFLAYVQSSSQGNPFIAVQLTKYLLETDSLELSDKTYLMKELTAEMPDCVQAILVARIDRLEADLKRIVHTASVLGCEFAQAVLCFMLDDVQDNYASLSAEIVQSKLQLGELEHIWNAVSEISYIFSHSLLRDAAYGMQLLKQLRHLHLLAAKAMKHYYGEDKNRFSQIAYHYEKAGDAVSAADYYLKAGDFEKDMFRFKAALEYYTSATNLTLSVRGNHHLDYAKCLTRIGLGYWSKSEFDQTLPYFEQALSIQEDILGKEQPETADNLHNIGSYHYVKGNYEQALSYYQKALAIQRRAFGKQHPDTASSLNSIGNVYRDCKDFSRALDYYEQALAIRIELWGDKHASIAFTYNDIADVYWSKGDYNQAMTFYEQALSIRQQVLGDKHPETATSLNCVGDIYSQMGSFDKALANYQKALSIRMETIGNRHTYTADGLNNIGIVYDITGEFEKALQYFEQALQIKLQVFGDLHIEVATVLTNIGGVYDHQGEYDRALEQHEKALLIWMEVLGEKYPETASCLNNIGCAYENKGEFDRALSYYEKALSIFLDVLGENCLETSTALVNIGCIHENKQEYQTALSFNNRALSIRREVLGEEHPATERTKGNIARLIANSSPET